MKKVLIGCLMLLFCGIYAVGQTVNNTALVGTVTDATGAVVVGAHVVAVNEDTKVAFDAVTNAQGYYNITGGINPGTYDVTVTQTGFQKQIRTGAVVTLNEASRTDFSLKPGETSTEVSVSANTPAIQTDDALLGETVPEQMVADLPVNGNNPLNLAATMSNVTVSGTDSLSGNPPGVQVTGAGARGVNNGITLDGITIMNDLIVTTTLTTNRDSLTAVQMQTGNYTAQYGDYLGTHVNEATKSGTNQFHGTAFDFIQNDAFNSRGFNHTSSVVPLKTHFRYNEFGGVVDGPVLIPHVINGRDKLFFMGSYQGQRQNKVTNSFFQAWTPAERNGDFSVLLNPAYIGSNKPTLLYSPFDGHAYFNTATGTQIIDDQPSSQKTIVKNILAYAPVANNLNPGDTTGNATNIASNAVAPVPSTETYNQSNDRVDYTPTEKDIIFGRYIFQKALVVGGSTSVAGINYGPTNSRNASLGYTRIITPNLVNDFRVGFNWIATNSLNYFAENGIQNADTQLGIPGFNIGTPTGNPGLPDITGTNIFGIGESGTNWPQDERTYQLYDQVSWTKGRHSLMAGADIRRNALARSSANDARGAEGFSSSYTGAAGTGAPTYNCGSGTNGNPPPCSIGPYNGITGVTLGNADASLFDGVAATSVTPITQAKIEVQQYRDGFFVQDQWLVSKKLTLQYGVRYELPLVPTSLNGTGRILDPTYSFLTPSIPAGCTSPSCALGANPGFKFHGPTHGDIAPRLGFAYRVTDRITLRGGGGVYYSEIQMNAYTLMNNNFPLANSQNYQSPTAGSSQFQPQNQSQLVLLSNPTPGAAQGFVTPGPGGTPCNLSNGTGSCASAVFSDQYYMPSETEYQWNLDNGIELWRNAGLELQYLGQHSVHLNYSLYNNQPEPCGCAPNSVTSSVNARRPDLNWGQKRILYNGATASYNAMTVNFRQRTSHGLTANVSYTWSQSLDEENYANGGGSPMWQKHEKLDYGNSTQGNIKHRVVASFTYQIPTFDRSNLLVREALGGWQVNGIITLASAPQSNITLSTDWANTGQPGQSARMNWVHAPSARVGIGCSKAVLLTQPYGSNTPSCVDSTAYAAPAQYTYGNAHKNDLAGVNGTIGDDLSLFKTFKLYERLNFRLSAEAFNAFNHANMGNPGGSFSITAKGTQVAPLPPSLSSSSSFGQAGIGSAGRTVQLSGRVSF